MSSLSVKLALIQIQFIRYLYSAYLIFGVTGCCLNVILFTRRQFRSVSCCIYFMVASVMMLFCLLYGTIPFLISLNQTNPFTTIVAICKSRIYLIQVVSMIYRWCLVAACFDRYLTTSTKVYLRNFARARVAYYVTTILTIVWFIIPIHIPIFYNLKDGRCGVFNNIGIALYHSLYSIVMASLLPITLFVISLILIRRNLRTRRQRRRTITNQRKRDHQALVMLLFQIVFYILTQTPFMIFNIYSAATIYVSNKSADRVAIEQFVSFIAESMLYFFPVLSFYLYTLASKTFREELINLFRYLIRHHRPNQINPVTLYVPVQNNNSTTNTTI